MSRVEPDTDAALVQDILTAIVSAKGRGGLTWLAAKLGMTVSALRKRLRSAEGAFDAPTMRAVLLVLALKAERFTDAPKNAEKHGRFMVEIYETEDGIEHAWKTL